MDQTERSRQIVELYDKSRAFIADEAGGEHHGKRAKTLDSYKSDNMDIYEFSEVKWPPARSDHAYCVDFCGMTDQEAETAIFLAEAFPPSDNDFGQAACVDVSDSLKKLIGWPLGRQQTQLKNPWCVNFMPKLTPSSRILVRVAPDEVTCPKIRLATGLEAMSFIGWDPALYQQPNTDPYRYVELIFSQRPARKCV